MTSSASDLLASLVRSDGHRWGEDAVEVQMDDATAILDTSGPPYHYLTRARGYSKTDDLGAIAIAVMLEQLPAASRLYGLASDRDQGRLLVDSVAGFAQRTPGLSSALRADAFKITATRLGSTFEVIPADAPGAYGLRPAFLVVDELGQWASTAGPRTLWEATTSAMAKVPGSRLVTLTTASDPSHWAHKVLEHARTDPLWHTHEVPGPPPWADPGRLAEQRRRLPESVYRRLFENEWVTGEDRLSSPDDLRAAVCLDGPLPYNPRWRYVIALDLGIRGDRTVAAVMHAEPILTRIPTSNVIANDAAETITGSRIFLDRLEVWSGTRDNPVVLADVENWVAQAARIYSASVVADPWQAIGLAQNLRARGVSVTEFNFSAQSVGRLAATLHVAIRNHQLALPDDPELLSELSRVTLRETSPGILRMDHASGEHDDRAVALALGAHHLLQAPNSAVLPRWGATGADSLLPPELQGNVLDWES